MSQAAMHILKVNAKANADQRVWRVFYTRARAEKKCELLLQEREIEVMLPKQVVIRQWKDRKQKVVEPLFPNYIFAQVEETERRRVLQTPGIVRCVSYDGVPAKVTDDEMEQIRILQNEPHRLRRMHGPVPEIGEEVTIREAPFKGLRGKVKEHRNQLYLIVEIAAIRQALRVQIPAEWVRSSRTAA